MKYWQIYLNLSGQFDNCHVKILADDVIQNGQTSVIADTVVIDFGNEILGLSEAEDE